MQKTTVRVQYVRLAESVLRNVWWNTPFGAAADEAAQRPGTRINHSSTRPTAWSVIIS